MLQAAKQDDNPKTLDTLLLGWATRLSTHIYLEPYRERGLQRTLSTAGMDLTPQIYLASCYLKAGLVLLGVIPCLLIFPIFSPLIVIVALMVYFNESGRPSQKAKEKLQEIQSELPRFVATLEQELAASRDVLGMLDRYKKHAGAAFARELEVLCADMRSSSYEMALLRFEGRMGCPQVSDIVQGLRGVLRGDDGRTHFHMLAIHFKQEELRALRAKAEKIPPRIRVFSFIMLACFVLTYVVVFGYELIRAMGNLF